VISPFGVEYREVSKAQVQLGDKEKNAAVAAGTAGGAYAGHWAYLTPDHAYNEHIHKPWFDHQLQQAKKLPKKGEVETAKATIASQETKQAASAAQNKTKAVKLRERAVKAPKEMKPDFWDQQARDKSAATHLETKAAPIPDQPAYDRAKAVVTESERKTPRSTSMTREQADKFIERTEVPDPKHQKKYKYDASLPNARTNPKNVKAIGEHGTNWHKSKGFFRDFPKDLPGSNYRRAGGWYSKGRTGHAVAIGAMGVGAYLGYKGTKKAVESKPLNQKVDKALKVPKALRLKYVPESEISLKNWKRVIRDPGFVTPAVTVPAAGATGYAMSARKKKAGKKEL
jgi:hypothetical protein